MTTHLCECGCNLPTRICKHTVKKYGQIMGQPYRFRPGHKLRLETVKRYRWSSIPGRHLHVVRAEQALGHRLPAGAEVHHADGTRGDTSPLVICQNHAYHMFLHQLRRVRLAGGNPHTQRICHRCKRVLDFDQFPGDPLHRKPRRGNHCNECGRTRHRANRAKALGLITTSASVDVIALGDETER